MRKGRVYGLKEGLSKKMIYQTVKRYIKGGEIELAEEKEMKFDAVGNYYRLMFFREGYRYVAVLEETGKGRQLRIAEYEYDKKKDKMERRRYYDYEVSGEYLERNGMLMELT